MARDREPVTDEEINDAEAGIREHNRRVREALAEDLGGDPEEYDPRARAESDDAVESE